MALIEIETLILAPIERVFDLARSIDAHMSSTSETKERAIEGKVSGLMEEGETVTWEATHFGIKQKLTVRMTKIDRPTVFEDRMISGAFKSLFHRYQFKETDKGTLMIDHFEFEAPLGILGRFAEVFFLSRYMKNFILKRSHELKIMAESDAWKKYLADPDV